MVTWQLLMRSGGELGPFGPKFRQEKREPLCGFSFAVLGTGIVAVEACVGLVPGYAVHCTSGYGPLRSTIVKERVDYWFDVVAHRLK